MTTRRKEIFDFALAQLEAGLLVSNLPGELMRHFNLPPLAAGILASKAVERWQKQQKRQDKTK